VVLSAPQAAPTEIASCEPIEQPPRLPVDPPAALKGKTLRSQESLLASTSDGEAPAARAQVASTASNDLAQESPSKSASPKPRSTADAGRSARKTLSPRQIWFMVWGAFALGGIGYLALGKTTSAPSEPPPAAHSSAATPSSPVAPPPSPAVPPASRVAPPAPAPAVVKTKPATGQPEQLRPGLAAPPATADDLRRNCLETDAGGKGKAKAVSNACRLALEAEPKNVEIMVILARAEIDRGRLGEARSLARKALATDPQRLDAYVFLGTAEQEAGRIDDARAAYKKYLDLAPDGPYARELRAILNNL
jgi:hypothetical protein